MLAKTKSTLTTLPLSSLSLDPVNARRNRGEPSPEFVASLLSHGVIEPLQVRPNGDGHMVFAGGERLRGLEQLARAGKIAADFPVRADIHEGLSDAEAHEMSLAENIGRRDMHPVDEYRAFAELSRSFQTEQRLPPADAAAIIAQRFGLDALHVAQRLALGALDEKILDAWLRGEIDEKAAEAFTLCPSKKAQVAIYEQVKKRGGVNAHYVHHALKADNDNPGRFLSFVAISAYEARGGKVTRDLFGKNHIVSDGKLMMAMVAEKLDETCNGFLDDGWAWAMQTPNERYNYGKLHGKAKVPAELTAKLKALRVAHNKIEEADEWDNEADDRLQAEIAIVEANIERVAYTAEQKAKAGVFVTIESDGTVEFSFGNVKPAEKKSAAASERKATPSGKPAPKPSDAKVVSNALAARLGDQLVAATQKALKSDTLPKGAATILQEIVARQINRYMPDAVSRSLAALRDALTPKVMNEAIRKEFNKADYFENAPKPLLLAAITEAIGPDEARKLSGKKKIEMAKFAAANVGKTAWLPKELRTANYDGPQAKAAATTAKRKKAGR